MIILFQARPFGTFSIGSSLFCSKGDGRLLSKNEPKFFPEIPYFYNEFRKVNFPDSFHGQDLKFLFKYIVFATDLECKYFAPILHFPRVHFRHNLPTFIGISSHNSESKTYYSSPKKTTSSSPFTRLCLSQLTGIDRSTGPFPFFLFFFPLKFD